ncbi:hypothetical protein yc1106_00646 [Curvularia clavata]|uniref:Uncharacterized protein n=1 Tax=Curvularia clavata TaxID=95742 RepID=A0A9Q9DNG7_CURCL|nr:hypothetical protein yc1106_00646 [Curvularia clavata]
MAWHGMGCTGQESRSQPWQLARAGERQSDASASSHHAASGSPAAGDAAPSPPFICAAHLVCSAGIRAGAASARGWRATARRSSMSRAAVAALFQDGLGGPTGCQERGGHWLRAQPVAFHQSPKRVGARLSHPKSRDPPTSQSGRHLQWPTKLHAHFDDHHRLMRRPPVACRRAVQSLQLPAAHHIWISDDLLALALNRFFPSSCPHQRRHGSHIPGPLEARRRAAKRRMTVSAGFHPQDSLQSLLNWNTLFGFRRDSQPAWRYEAPSLQPSARPPDLSNQQPENLSVLLSNRAQDEYATTTAETPIPPPTVSLQDLYPIASQGNGPQGKTHAKVDRAGPASASVVTTSGNLRDTSVLVQACFDNFRSKIVGMGDLSPAERNRILVEAWRSCCPTRSDAWVYNTMVLEHLGNLGCDPSNILCEQECFTLPPLYTPESQSLISCLEKCSKRFVHAAKVYHRMFMKLAESAESAEASKNLLQDAELLCIVRLALQGADSLSTEAKNTVAQSLAVVADKIHNSHVRSSLRSILVGTTNVEQATILLLARTAVDYDPCATVEQVLSGLPQKHLQSLISPITLSLATAFARNNRPSEHHGHRLSTWLTVLESLDGRSAHHKTGTAYFDVAIAAIIKRFFSSRDPGMWSHVLLHPLAFRLTQQEAYAAYRDRVLQLIHAFPALAHMQKEPLGFETILALVFSQMKREALPYASLIDMTVKVFARHADLFSIYRVLFALNQQGLALQSISRVHARVRKEIASLPDRPESLSQRERQHYAFHLRTSQGIVDLLAKLTSPSIAGSLSDTRKQLSTLQARREFAEILDRARENRALPQMYANTSVDISASDRTILIHQLAHLYSLSATRSHRETWRSIYYLSHYLQSYSLPVGPLFTKAVVRAAIIRPMMEHRFISARRLIWVCQLVAKAEGEDVAKQIESNYWRWRGQLIRQAKRAHDDAGGDYRNKALISRMKGLGLV